MRQRGGDGGTGNIVSREEKSGLKCDDGGKSRARARAQLTRLLKFNEIREEVGYYRALRALKHRMPRRG